MDNVTRRPKPSWSSTTGRTLRRTPFVRAWRVRAAVDDLAGSGAPLRFLHSTFVPEEESALCVFSSAVPGLVEQAYRQAGVSFERILSVLEIAPGEPTEQPTNED